MLLRQMAEVEEGGRVVTGQHAVSATRCVDASASTLFDVLIDPWTYPEWVVGARRIRAVDDDWPRPGARFHHALGAGPAELKDSTALLRAVPDQMVVLDVRFRPAGRGVVYLHLADGGDGRTRVTMDELATSGPVRLLWPVARPLIWLRNSWSLLRLDRVARVCAESE